MFGNKLFVAFNAFLVYVALADEVTFAPRELADTCGGDRRQLESVWDVRSRTVSDDGSTMSVTRHLPVLQRGFFTLWINTMPTMTDAELNNNSALKEGFKQAFGANLNRPDVAIEKLSNASDDASGKKGVAVQYTVPILLSHAQKVQIVQATEDVAKAEITAIINGVRANIVAKNTDTRALTQWNISLASATTSASLPAMVASEIVAHRFCGCNFKLETVTFPNAANASSDDTTTTTTSSDSSSVEPWMVLAVIGAFMMSFTSTVIVMRARQTPAAAVQQGLTASPSIASVHPEEGKAVDLENAQSSKIATGTQSSNVAMGYPSAQPALQTVSI